MTAQLESLFPSITGALLTAQDRLDSGVADTATCAIPRLAVDIRFALSVHEQNRFLIFFGGRKGGWRQQQRVRYTLTAEPQPPQESPVADVPVHWTITTPPYLLDAPIEQQIAAEVASQLDQGHWHFRGSRSLDAAEVRREAERIRASMVNLVEGRGMIVFQTGTACYLAIRVADRAANDGVFLYRPSVDPAVAIFSMQNDGEEAMSVEPLLHLLSAVRGSCTASTHCIGPPQLNWGWAGLRDVIGGLANGYASALQLLAARTPAAGCYHAHGFEADLVYSSWNPEHQHREQQAAADPFQAAGQWIHNRVRIGMSASLQRGQASLLAPEFVLDGEARAELLAQLIAAAPAIQAAFAQSTRDAGNAYSNAIHNPSSHDRVVVALAYDKLPPDQDFLVVWPAGERDFVFSCTSDGVRVRDIAPVLGMDAPAGAVRFNHRQFASVHNFFRAIRLWRTRQQM